MSNFDEKSGVEYCQTEWGQWAQTIDEVFVEVDVAPGTKAREITCHIKPNSLSVAVKNEQIIKGNLFGITLADESIWTLEDKKLLRVVLIKSDRTAGNCWRSLLQGQYKCDDWVFDKMEKKLTLERFQRENPGFDFSGADITGNYSGGGPKLES